MYWGDLSFAFSVRHPLGLRTDEPALIVIYRYRDDLRDECPSQDSGQVHPRASLGRVQGVRDRERAMDNPCEKAWGREPSPGRQICKKRLRTPNPCGGDGEPFNAPYCVPARTNMGWHTEQLRGNRLHQNSAVYPHHPQPLVFATSSQLLTHSNHSLPYCSSPDAAFALWYRLTS